jgi:hypothetical protein
MKNLIIIASSCLLVACSQSPKTETQATGNQEQISAAKTDSAKYYGEAITPDNAITIEEMRKLMGDKKELAVKVTAPVQAVCKKKGCWMELTAADGTTMRVTFKDYGFFVPTDADGRTATIQGVAKVEETSVADLKEYAKDDGQSKEQIAAIKEPKKELVFEATGVILQ